MKRTRSSSWSKLIGKNVIITLKPWSESRDKQTLEGIGGSLPEGVVVPDLVYRSKETFQARLESVTDEKVHFFVTEERYFSFRAKEDIISIVPCSKREKRTTISGRPIKALQKKRSHLKHRRVSKRKPMRTVKKYSTLDTAPDHFGGGTALLNLIGKQHDSITRNEGWKPVAIVFLVLFLILKFC